MENKYKGKKVLLLGTGIEYRFLMPYLKEQGAHIVLASPTLSAGEFCKYVDEMVELKSTQIDEIVAYCKENNVDGVLSVSVESAFERCRIINEKLGNKFLYTEKQWNTFCQKDNFKNVCAKYGIRTPNIYFSGNEGDFKKAKRKNFRYPLVVKPVDSCGGLGCYRCDFPFELNILAKHSYSNSQSKNIIIEEFLKGQEATLTFVIQDGICKLVSATDRYVNYKRKFKESVHSYFVSPSVFADDFMNCDFQKFEAMFLGEGLNNCSIFVQGFFIDKSFVPTEAGLRFEGTLAYLNNKHFNGQDYMAFSVDQILNVETDYDVNEDSYMLGNKICLYMGVYLKKGQIKFIQGIDKMEKLEGHYLTTQYRNVGDYVNGMNSVTRILVCFNYFCTTHEEMIKKIKIASKIIKVKNTRGRNMILKFAKIKNRGRIYGRL